MKTNMKMMVMAAMMTVGIAAVVAPKTAMASGGSGGGGSTTVKVDSIKVSKCYYAIGGQMLIKAASSDATATLSAYLPNGAYLGAVQNGGGSRYGGTVMGYVGGGDPGSITIKSSSGGSITVPTTPFQI